MKERKDYYKFTHGFNNEEFKNEFTCHDETIYTLLESFKQFLAGCGYGERTIERIQLIEDEE